MLPRLHLFEFNDQAWLPQFMTAWMTRVLNVCHEESQDGKVWAVKVRELIEKSGQTRVVDLCSGGGGPVLQMARVLKEEHGIDVHVTLTDFIPNLQSAAEINGVRDDVVYITDSINATSVPNELVGIRTAFSGLHHLREKDARALLKNAFENRQYIFLGETTSRSYHAMVMYACAARYFGGIAKQTNLTPKQSFFTFRIPVLPIMLGWDNVVSCWRTYSERELRQMIEPFVASDYLWEIGSLRNPKWCVRYPYIMGCPVALS